MATGPTLHIDLPVMFNDPPPSRLLADNFDQTLSSINGRILPDGNDTTKAWVFSGVGGIKLQGGAARAASGNAPARATVNTTTVAGRLRGVVGTLLMTSLRRLYLEFGVVDGNNLWSVNARPAPNVLTWQLQKVVNGTITSIGLAGPAAAPGDAIEIIYNGNGTISWSVNGVVIDTVTGQTPITTPVVGMRFQWNASDNSTMDQVSSWTSFAWEEAPA